MSLALIRYVEFELHKNNLHYPIDQLHFLLNQMRVIKIHHADNNLYVLLEDAPVELIPVYKALNVKWHKKFSHETILL